MTNEMIFVFGSNESGIHGAGAAKYARTKGAVMGVGFGRQGNTFAIPTKNWNIGPMSLFIIEHYVHRFLAYAELNSNLKFQVTCIGCGLGGWTHKSIAPMFKEAPDNCFFDTNWRNYMNSHQKYWGSF